jgi:tetratricopeptide (TPR) repeat protein
MIRLHHYSRLSICALCAGALLPVSVLAQNSTSATSREIVQQTPSAEVEQLRAALQRLAREPRSVGALVDAGDASLGVGDLDAAMGFFGRALELEPANAQAKLGMASVNLRARRPLEALRMFAEAERAGASTDAILGDFALAQDLVGNNQLAQESYRAALARDADDELSRRLAISLAISGDRAGFEAALLPLLQRQDLAAYRTRAFGLAILGDTDQATSLANSLMPADLASRMTPYLAFMPRLTKSQQAAAANLGIFPRAAEIGRDDPRIARFASTGELPPVVNADKRLEPRGTPLGQRDNSRPSQPTPQQTSRLAEISRAQEQATPSLLDAFSELADPVAAAEARDGAVDITQIDIPREAREPDPSQHPARHWVQMATGRDRSALLFDWRRMVRRAPELLGDRSAYVTRWGQASRLLTGPFDSRDDARELVSSLRAQGFDSFTYSSPEGEEITELQ